MVVDGVGRPSEVLRHLGATEVGICDLATLHGATDQEYALLVKREDGSEERALVRGGRYSAYIPRCFLEQGFVWYAHSHPGDVTEPSDDDRKALQQFQMRNGQEKSVIVTESGKCNSFKAVEDLSNWTPP